MNTIIAGALTAILFFPLPVLPPAQDGRAAENVTGRWTMTVDGGPHGSLTMGLVLEQQGKKVSGTFASPHGDMPVEGEFVDGELSLKVVSSDGDREPITFQARLKGDTLSGYLSSEMGDMTWTAVRSSGQ